MQARDLFKARQGIALFRSAACSETVKLIGAEKDRELRRDKFSPSPPFSYSTTAVTTTTATLSKSSRRSFTNTLGSSSPQTVLGLCTRSSNSLSAIDILRQCRLRIARLNIGTFWVTMVLRRGISTAFTHRYK